MRDRAARMALLRRLMARRRPSLSWAWLFDRHPAWIRHHVLALLKAGLVELGRGAQDPQLHGEGLPCKPRARIRYTCCSRPNSAEQQPLLDLGSHDFAVEALASLSCDRDGHPEVVTVPTGSLDGLDRAAPGTGRCGGLPFDRRGHGRVQHALRSAHVPRPTHRHRHACSSRAGTASSQAATPRALRTLDDIAEPGSPIRESQPGFGHTCVARPRARRERAISHRESVTATPSRRRRTAPSRSW